MGETNEELSYFTSSFEDDLAVLQAYESNEKSKETSYVRTLRSISNNRCFVLKLLLLCYKTIASWL